MLRIIRLLIVALILAPVSTRAQEQLQFSVLDVELWPEYDRPTMLVIYRATLSPEVSLPVEVTFRIPASAGEPHAVAVGTAQGAVGDVVYSRQLSGEWALISFIAALPVIQFEYYDPALIKDGISRQFVYTWTGDYLVDSFSMRVQQPVGAYEFRLSPDIGASSQGQDGLWYRILEVGALAAGDSFSISVDYQKDTDELSAESLRIQPSAPISRDTEGRVDLGKATPWVLGALGVIFILGGGLWYWQSNREEPVARRITRRKPARMKNQDIAPEGDRYCHQCGKRAHPGDRFCRACGAKLHQV